MKRLNQLHTRISAGLAISLTAFLIAGSAQAGPGVSPSLIPYVYTGTACATPPDVLEAQTIDDIAAVVEAHTQAEQQQRAIANEQSSDPSALWIGGGAAAAVGGTATALFMAMAKAKGIGGLSGDLCTDAGRMFFEGSVESMKTQARWLRSFTAFKEMLQEAPADLRAAVDDLAKAANDASLPPELRNQYKERMARLWDNIDNCFE